MACSAGLQRFVKGVVKNLSEELEGNVAKIPLNRIIPVYGTINMDLAVNVQRLIREYAAQSSDPIGLLVSSSGGQVMWGLAIAEMVRLVPSINGLPIWTIGMSFVGSAAADIWLSAPKDRRILTARTQLYFHRQFAGESEVKLGGPLEAVIAQLEELLTQYRQGQQSNSDLVRRLVNETNVIESDILSKLEKGWYLSALEAKSVGLVEHIQ